MANPLDSVMNAASNVSTQIINAWGNAQVAKYSQSNPSVPPAPVYGSDAPAQSNNSMLMYGGLALLAFAAYKVIAK